MTKKELIEILNVVKGNPEIVVERNYIYNDSDIPIKTIYFDYVLQCVIISDLEPKYVLEDLGDTDTTILYLQECGELKDG